MKAILVRQPGGVENLEIGEFPDPQPGPEEVLIRVKATALNRADILQRQGKYPPPPGCSPLLGLEAAGVVEKAGEKARPHWKPGDRVMTLLPSGGYAQYVVTHWQMALPIPDNLSFAEAAAIPEVFLTAFQVLRWIARMQEGEWVLIHGGAGGVGTAAIQLVRVWKGHAVVTVGTEEKARFCQQLGAERAILYRKEDFVSAVLQYTQEKGAHIIIDHIGAPYWEKNLQALALDGRIVLISTLGGSRVTNCDLRLLFRKRATVHATTLRARSLEYKIRLTQDFRQQVLPLFHQKILKPIIDRVYPWEEVAQAHQRMEANQNIGKIVLTVS